MNINSPFNLKTFNTFQRSYFIFFIIGVIFYFFSEDNILQERSLVLISLFFILFIILVAGKKMFVEKKNEILGLWLLYISMIFLNTAIPILAYVTGDYENMIILIKKCLLMFFIGIAMTIYLFIIGKYGHNFFTETIKAYVSITPVLLLLIVPMIVYRNEDFSSTFMWIGSFFLTATIGQYRRILAYSDQRDLERYGKFIKYLKEKKGRK